MRGRDYFDIAPAPARLTILRLRAEFIELCAGGGPEAPRLIGRSASIRESRVTAGGGRLLRSAVGALGVKLWSAGIVAGGLFTLLAVRLCDCAI